MFAKKCLSLCESCFEDEDPSKQTDAKNMPCSGECKSKCFDEFDYPSAESYECSKICLPCFEQKDKDANGDSCNRLCEPTCEKYKECIVAGYCPMNCIPEGSQNGATAGRRNLLFASMPVCPPCCADKLM